MVGFHYLFNSLPVCKAQKLKPAAAAVAEMSSEFLNPPLAPTPLLGGQDFQGNGNK